jgi:hypothetical protein
MGPCTVNGSGSPGADRVLRYTRHASVQQPIAREVQGIDFDFGFLIDVNEADVAIRHHGFNLEMAPACYESE